MLINNFILSESILYDFLSSKVLDIINSKAYKIDSNEIKNIAYACWHKHNTGLSDHIFLDQWEKIEQKNNKEALSILLINDFKEYYFEKDKRYISIKLDKFGEWQNLLGHISGFPMIAFKLFEMEDIGRKEVKFNFNRNSFIKSKLGFRTIISPYHKLVEDYIIDNGLNESHIHLNGTTTMEHFWLDALNEPDILINNLINEGWNKSHIKRLYILDPIFNTPDSIYNLLVIAGLLRDIIKEKLSNHKKVESINKKINDLACCLKNKKFAKLQFSSLNKLTHENRLWNHIDEIELHVNTIEYLKANPKDKLTDSFYLLYIICMNCFIHLTAQPFYQKGFEQFQKFADNGVREEREKKYTTRFYQLHGPNYSNIPDLKLLEGRFSPKKTLAKNEAILKEILIGFVRYAKGKNYSIWEEYDINSLITHALSIKRPKFRLIAHFIKKSLPPGSIPYHIHFRELREDVDTNLNALLELFFKYPTMRNLITGIDVAANELDAPPEVFAPLYRKCRENGIKHFTYHVGEDFKSLVNGIRAIYDAIVLLELNNGDRIGHATAIGIDPQYWIDKVPDSFYISQGQFLEDLLFVRKIALEYDTSSIPLYKIEQQITELTLKIFGDSIDSAVLHQFYDNRFLNPIIIKQIKDNGCILDKHELKITLEKYFNEKKSVDLLWKRWKDNFFDKESIYKKYEKKILVEKDFFPPEVLLKIQQYVQKIVSDRNIIIETLPTSNVRISLYEHIREHHIFRWLQIDGRKFEGDVPMQISMGSDDTGIFVTDLRNEFYHIFSVLVNDFKYEPRKALELVSSINKNGLTYHFDYKKNENWNEIFAKGAALYTNEASQ